MLNTTPGQLKIVLLIICYLVNIILGGPDQRRLLKRLLIEKQYNVLERPVKNDSDTLPVSINLALQQLIEFDGKNEVLIISGWLVFMWKDYSLAWDPTEYGGIQTIRMPSTQIWTPDILLYNSADEKFDSTIRVNAVVQHTGDVLYVPPGIFKSVCSFDITNFPFDTQNCTLKFGSWTFDDAGINLTAESNKGQLDAYIPSGEWDLQDFYATNNALKYACCPNLYPFVLYTIQIRRRSLYYLTNVVVPCVLISCMTILGFLLAPESGEKLTLQITILLSAIMFSTLLSDIMPPTSNAIPIITMYFMCITIMSSASVAVSVLIISLHFRNADRYKMPLWIRKYICDYLACLLRMKRPRYDLTWRSIRRRWTLKKKEPKEVDESIENHYFKTPSPSVLKNGLESLLTNATNNNQDDEEKQHVNTIFHYSAPSTSKIKRSDHKQNLSRASHLNDTEMIRSELRTIISQLAMFTNYMQQQEHHDDETQDWQFVAMVIDRLCLVIFIIAMVLFTSLTLLSAPNFFKFQ